MPLNTYVESSNASVNRSFALNYSGIDTRTLKISKEDGNPSHYKFKTNTSGEFIMWNSV